MTAGTGADQLSGPATTFLILGLGRTHNRLQHVEEVIDCQVGVALILSIKHHSAQHGLNTLPVMYPVLWIRIRMDPELLPGSGSSKK